MALLLICSCQKDQLTPLLAPCPEEDSAVVLRAQYTDEAGITSCISSTYLSETSSLRYPGDTNTLLLRPYQKMYLRLRFPLTEDEISPNLGPSLELLIRNTAVDLPNGPVSDPAVPTVYLSPSLILERLLFAGDDHGTRDIRFDLHYAGFSGFDFFSPAEGSTDLIVIESATLRTDNGEEVIDMTLSFDQLVLMRWYQPDSIVNLNEGRIQVTVPMRYLY